MKRFAAWVIKCKRLISGSLTAKTFLILLALLLIICFATYTFIGLFLPFADENQSRRRLGEKADTLIVDLRRFSASESGKLILSFIRQTGADLQLLNESREPIDLFTFAPANAERMEGREYPFRFDGSAKEFVLVIRYNSQRADETSKAIWQSTPWAGGVILLLSIVSALLFSRYAARPIIRMSKIASHIADLDFSWYCPDMREDEIGALAKSLNELSDKLSAALSALRRRNLSLAYEVELEKARERKQLLFFSAVSHELKTPIAIAIGQLEGMQAGIGVYQDREKYLGRCAEILRSLDTLIKELLSVSRMDISGKIAAPVNVSELLQSSVNDCLPLIEQGVIKIVSNIEPGIFVLGDAALLKKALINVIGNAAIYSPQNAEIEVRLNQSGDEVRLDITNSPAHIEEEHFPYLFDAFYRAGGQGGGIAGQGSGLGLYITRVILESHGAPHSIENYGHGVRFSAAFKLYSNSI